MHLKIIYILSLYQSPLFENFLGKDPIDQAVLALGTTFWRRNCDYVFWIATHIGITKIDGKREVCNDLARNASITVGYLGPTHGFSNFHFSLRQRVPMMLCMPFLDCRNVNHLQLMNLAFRM